MSTIMHMATFPTRHYIWRTIIERQMNPACKRRADYAAEKRPQVQGKPAYLGTSKITSSLWLLLPSSGPFLHIDFKGFSYDPRQTCVAILRVGNSRDERMRRWRRRRCDTGVIWVGWCDIVKRNYAIFDWDQRKLESGWNNKRIRRKSLVYRAIRKSNRTNDDLWLRDRVLSRPFAESRFDDDNCRIRRQSLVHRRVDGKNRSDNAAGCDNRVHLGNYRVSHQCLQWA